MKFENKGKWLQQITESFQKNEGIEEQQDAIAKKIADALSAKFGWVLSKEGPYEEYYIGKGLNPINVKIKNDKDLQVQLRASAQPRAFKSVKDAIDFIKSNMNAYGFPGASAFYGKLQSKANKNIERQKARDTYLHDISDSSQKNEALTNKEIAEVFRANGFKMVYVDANHVSGKKGNTKVWTYMDEKTLSTSDEPYTKGNYPQGFRKDPHYAQINAKLPTSKEELDKLLKSVKIESAQINETRGYKVIVELGVPDNMNNRDIEDEVERLLRSSHKIDVVIDVTAERS